MVNFKEVLESIGDSVRSIDLDAFEKLKDQCIDILQNAGKIIVTGLGKNVPVCEKFVGSMVSLGLNAFFMDTNAAIHGDLGMVKDEDLIIILTKSGETRESVYLNELLKDRKAIRWLLSFSAESLLAKEIEHSLILHLNHEGDPFNIMPVNSTTVTLIVLQELVMSIAREMHIPLKDLKRNHPGGAIGEKLKEG